MTVAIIDGDVVAYMACENRYLGVIDRILKGTGKETVGITDLEEHLADRVVEHDDGLEVPSLEEMRLLRRNRRRTPRYTLIDEIRKL